MDIDKEQREQLKSWLRRYQELQAEANQLWERLDDLRGRVEATRTSHLDGLPHAHGGDADWIGADLSRLEDLEQEAREVQQEATASRREVETAIRKIRGTRWADRRKVLRLRYLDGLRWEDVTERLLGILRIFGIGKTCFCAGRSSYIHRHWKNWRNISHFQRDRKLKNRRMTKSEHFYTGRTDGFGLQRTLGGIPRKRTAGGRHYQGHRCPDCCGSASSR